MRFRPKDPKADHQLAKLYNEICETGFGHDLPINWFTSQSQRLDILQATWALTKGILVNGKLPPTVKQMIAMTISIQNSCRYCEVTHTAALEGMGVPKDVIQSCVREIDTAKIPHPHRQIIKYALKAAKDPNSISDKDLETLRKAGLNDAEIMEATMMAAFTNFINTWADAAGVPIDHGQERAA